MNYIIREYTKEDVEGIKKCILELKQFEQMLDPDRLEGMEIAQEYLEYLLDIHRADKGKLFVVEIGNEIIGMVSVSIHTGQKDTRSYAEVSDVMILPEFKDKGIMKALLEKAEEYAQSKKLSAVRTTLLSKHAEGIDGFQRNGYSNYEIILQKKLD
ncbi:MAG TPA: GNAT family N-acetyltransferase [Candidatus Woesebacteria bacterium]|nr:GNAT family N-acetyltransferase [Candidatus Woesebacteria bacterium]